MHELARLDVEHVLHPVTNHFRHQLSGPTVIDRGEGVWLYDVDGNQYLDASACLWNVNVGHGRKEIADAMGRQGAQLAFASTFSGQSHPTQIELAARLSKLAPEGLNSSFFTTGGSECNETAFKLARFYWNLKGQPNKVKVISRRQAYHGITMAATAATGVAAYHQGFEPLVSNFLHAPAPHCYRCELNQTYPGCGLACAGSVEQMILAEGPDRVAAVIVEPVQGAGGVIVPPPGYMEEIRRVCDQHNVLLIADEVICGFGRTGRMWGVDHSGVIPDMMCIAKGITSGYAPLGAVMVNQEIRNTLFAHDVPFMHGFTYSGHPVCCAAALANLDILEREDLVEHSRQMGDLLLAELQQCLELPIVGNVRGLGLLAAVELVADKQSRRPFPSEIGIGARVAAAVKQRGVLLRPLGDSVAVSPPLIIDADQVKLLVSRLCDAIRAVAAEL